MVVSSAARSRLQAQLSNPANTRCRCGRACQRRASLHEACASGWMGQDGWVVQYLLSFQGADYGFTVLRRLLQVFWGGVSSAFENLVHRISIQRLLKILSAGIRWHVVSRPHRLRLYRSDPAGLSSSVPVSLAHARPQGPAMSKSVRFTVVGLQHDQLSLGCSDSQSLTTHAP